MLRAHYFRGIAHVGFVCGCGHTGTTLMATILSAHPEIHAAYRESEVFLHPWFTVQGRLRLLRSQWEASGKPWLVEKTPRHIRHLPLIRRTVPSARVIIMVRDGRDVTASIGRRERGNFKAGLDRWVLDTGLAAKERNSADVFIQRYEDLVADPEGAIRRICTFLGVEYAPEMLNYHEQPRLWYGKKRIEKTSGVGKEHAQYRNWQVNQPLYDGRGRWQAELPAEIVAAFDTGKPRELMKVFGYAEDKPPP
ncbi:MAG: sulfotransferase [Devosia sp.]